MTVTLIIQKFWAGCVSVLGIVFGEIVFGLFLILPPPFIQITLVYIESVWPYVIGLSLIIFIIFDLISNPYTNTMSLYQTNNQISSSISPVTKPTGLYGNRNLTRFLPKELNPIFQATALKIFGFSFLLALTEQSCYFSFFSSLNLSSTGNFLDTYLFSASRSPIILIFSCVGFLMGSFLSIILYNLVIAKIIFLVASLGVKIKQYNPNFFRNWISKRLDFKTPPYGDSSTNRSAPNSGTIYTQIKNNLISGLRNLFFSLKSKNLLNALWFKLRNLIQLLMTYLPGGKRIMSFLFPKQTHSYKSDFQTTSTDQWSREKDSADPYPQGGKMSVGKRNGEAIRNQSFPIGFKTEPKSAFLSIETKIENRLRSSEFRPAGRSNASSSSIVYQSSSDSSFNNNQPITNASSLGGSAFYNKIDKILLTCIITLSFTTIPYYSFDYLINSFFGFIPQDQILNAHSLRVNFPDYTNLLGITLSDNNSVINTDVSLYDRAHFMYGEWPNSFESLNYQGELMWTNLRDHRRQKRTRRSTRLKFKTLKTKISTSWKEFKLSSGFSGSTRQSSFDESIKEHTNSNYDNSKLKTLSKGLSPGSSQESDGGFTSRPLPSREILKRSTGSDNMIKAQKSLRNTNNLSNLFYKIFLAKPDSSYNRHLGESMFKTTEPLSQAQGIAKNEIIPRIPEETQRSNSLSETIKPLSTSTFIDLSGGEKYIKTYPKNWKRVITEKYYQNPIYRTVLTNDLKNFLKRQPLTQQLTNNQENELYFLRVKMAHYYDSLRFYFSLKESINSTRPKADTFLIKPPPPAEAEPITPRRAEKSEPRSTISDPKARLNKKRLETDPKKDFEKIYKEKPSQSMITRIKPPQDAIISLSGLPKQTRDTSAFSRPAEESTGATREEYLKHPPFQFKSMTSMNYRQQFKGTLKTVNELFSISLPESVPTYSNAQYEQNSTQSDGVNDSMYRSAPPPAGAELIKDCCRRAVAQKKIVPLLETDTILNIPNPINP